MEQEGLVTSDLESGGGPARKVYSITEEGRACLEQWLSKLRQFHSTLGRFLDEGDDS